MRIFNRVRELEARLDRLEAAASANMARDEFYAVTDKQLRAWLDRVESTAANGHTEEMTELGEMRSQINRYLTVHGDRLSSLNLKLDMVHSRVERVDRLQDEIRQTQDEHGEMLLELSEHLPHRDPAA